MKTTDTLIRRLKDRRLNFALAFTLIGAMATAARAESFSVQVPFAFAASGKSLPAGTYMVEPIAVGIVVIRGATAADTATIAASPAGYTDTSANPSLSFASSPDLAVLSSIRMDSGMTFTVATTKRLTAAIAKPAKGTVALSHP
jgi:hypothetical protein